jgi:glucan-binding YG repeat protein
MRAVNFAPVTGEPKNGFVNGRLYLNSNSPATGWVDYDGSTYYFNDYSEMYTGYKTVDGTLYEFSENGVLIGAVNGVITYDMGRLGTIERLYVDGYFQTGKVVYDGVTYICDENGTPIKGQTIIVDGYLYEIDENGSATAKAKSWYTDEATGNTYYAGNNGKLTVNASTKIDGFFYAFDENGVMIKNAFFKVGTGKRYFDGEGKGVHGIYEMVIVGYAEDGAPIYKTACFNATSGLMIVPAVVNY